MFIKFAFLSGHSDDNAAVLLVSLLRNTCFTKILCYSPEADVLKGTKMLCLAIGCMLITIFNPSFYHCTQNLDFQHPSCI